MAVKGPANGPRLAGAVPVEAVPAGGGGGVGAAEAEERMEEEGSKLVKMSLVSQHVSVAPGGETWLGVRFEITTGWHTYWRNSGDSGMPPTFEFAVEPAGALEIGEAQWPAPQRHLSAGDILDYVYEGTVIHWFKARVSDSVKAGDSIKVTCDSTWLVCKEACLPGEGAASMTIGVGEMRESSEERLPGDRRGMLPVDAADRLGIAWKGDVLEVRDNWGSGGAPMEFFPFAEEGDIVPNDLLKSGESKSGVMRFRFDGEDLKRGGKVRGVVRVEYGRVVPDAGTRAYLLEAPVPQRAE